MHYNKKAAIELSIGTVVIIVIAMTMLIMGIVLVRNIFSGATDSVNSLNDKVRSEITNLFTEEGSKIAIRLGADKIAKVKSGTDQFGLGAGFQTGAGGDAVAKHLQYRLILTNNGCSNFGSAGGIEIRDHQFTQNCGSEKCTPFYNPEQSEGENGYVVFSFRVPDGQEECTQRIKIETKDDDKNPIATATFRLSAVPGGIFSN